jgi:shikimate kinase
MNKVTLFAVAGNPVLASREPTMFRRALAVAGMNAVCIRLAMRDARETAETIRQLDIKGTSITSPFRETIIPFLDVIDDGARTTGSVNTVVNNAGRLKGYNTEHEGEGVMVAMDSTAGPCRRETRDAPTPGGRQRLLTGASRAFSIFTGRDAPLEEMEKALLEDQLPNPGRISFIGFMGAGKSSVGPAVAARLSMPHVDVDASIERKTGCTIGEIFRESGEEVFRRHERKEIRDILARRRCVMAAGGGSVLDGENVRNMKASSLVVWLFAGLDETLLRIGGGTARPLAVGKGTIRELFTGRIPLYARAAHLLVKTDRASIDEVAERIVHESDKAFRG